MASTSFRDSMNSLGWSRREADRPATTADYNTNPLLSKLSAMNPFGRGGYVSLPTHEPPGAPLPAPNRQAEEETYFALSRWDRMLVFGGCLVAAALCFMLTFLLWPVLILKPTKLVTLWSVGSLMFLCSWAALMGPSQYASHLLSGPRLPFTATYFGTLFMTIYFAVGLHSTILTLLAAIAQMIALAWYVVSYFPMGTSSMRFAASVGTSRVAAWMSG